MLLQIPAVLNQNEVQSLLGMLRSAQFEDGAASAGFVAREVKRNLQVPMQSETAQKGGAVVLDALRRNAMFYSAALPNRVYGPTFNRYDPGMTYGDHVDNAIMLSSGSVRTDVAATLFLSAPEDYDGGELTIQDRLGVQKVKLAAGGMIVYPGNSVHRVEPITRGSRLAAVLWIQSMVREDARRQSLFELDMALGSLRQKLPSAPEVATLTALYHNLLRMWAEN